MAPQKGKQGTVGAKQIVHDNKETLKFYKIMSLASGSTFVLTTAVLFQFTTSITILTILTLGTLIGAYLFMAMMAKAQFSENGEIIDSGNNLNMEGGIGEHVKDLIILISITLILSLITNYFWYLLLFVPFRVIYLLWGTVIKPWLSSKKETEQSTEADDKKQKKMEKRMKRMQNMR